MVYLISKRIKITEEIEEKRFLSVFGSLFEEFEYKGLSSCYFYLIFGIRRYAMVAAILFFSSYLFKILVAFVLSMIVTFIQAVLYLVFVKPFKDKINQVYLILNETITVTFWGYIALQNLRIIEYDRLGQGLNCIKIISLALGVNILFGLMSGTYSAYQFVKKLINRQVVPINNNFTIQASYYDTESSSNPLDTKK